LAPEFQADRAVKPDPSATATPPAAARQDHLDHQEHLEPMVNRELKVDLVTKERPPALEHHQ